MTNGFATIYAEGKIQRVEAGTTAGEYSQGEEVDLVVSNGDGSLRFVDGSYELKAGDKLVVTPSRSSSPSWRRWGMKRKAREKTLRVIVLDGMGPEGYGGAWVGRGVALARRHDRRIPAPRAVFVYRSAGAGSGGRAYMRTKEVVLRLSTIRRSGRPDRREINLGVLLHELRHLAQDPGRTRRWRESDARAFAESIIKSERRVKKDGKALKQG